MIAAPPLIIPSMCSRNCRHTTPFSLGSGLRKVGKVNPQDFRRNRRISDGHGLADLASPALPLRRKGDGAYCQTKTLDYLDINR